MRELFHSPISENGPWTPYTEPITVEEFASIWAYASKEGYNDSPVVNAEYIIQDDIVIIFWQEWENDWEPWQGWTERCTMGDSLWRVASYGGNHYAYAAATIMLTPTATTILKPLTGSSRPHSIWTITAT